MGGVTTSLSKDRDFGSVNIFFKMLPVAENSRHYFLLGQLSALAIIKIGRAPECIISEVINSMFSGHEKGGVEHEDGELGAVLRRLESGDTVILLDLDIPLLMMSDLASNWWKRAGSSRSTQLPLCSFEMVWRAWSPCFANPKVNSIPGISLCERPPKVSS